MEFLAHAEVNGTTGRWIVTPRKGARFVGDAERRKARVRDRRRRVLVFLIEAIGISLPDRARPSAPRRVERDAGARDPARRLRLDADLDEAPFASLIRRRPCANARIPGDHAAAFAARYVIEGRNGRPRETFNGLEGLAESDRVHVVVRPASAG